MTLLFTILISSLSIFAAERVEFYNGVRGLGMGGAQIATVNDETALLVNPAGLGKLRDMFITVADPELSLGSDTQSIIGLNIMTPLKPQEVLDLLKQTKHQAKRLHAAAQIFPSAVFPNFGLGIYANYIANSEIDVANSFFTYNYRSDISAVFGFNFRLWHGRIKLGFNIRAVNRNEINRTDLPTSSTGLTIESLTSEGVGIGSDVGLIFTVPWVWLPTLAVVYRDVGNTHYTIREGFVNNSNTRPESTEASLDAAFALFPIVGKHTRVTFSGEYRGVLTASDELDSMKRVHAGLEINFSDAIFLRGGMNQRYWTAGLEIAVANYQLQFATYGEEVGTATLNEEDRRYVGKFAYRF